MVVSVATAGALLLSAGGYVAADAYDLVPGVLTLDRPVPVPTPTVSGTPAPVLLPSPAPSADSLLTSGGDHAPAPTTAGLAAALTAASKDPALAKGLGVSVLDGVTGAELWAEHGTTPRVPASTAKLMAALAVSDTLDLGARMTTAVVASPGPADLVLVARGDTLLAPGRGAPDAVAGRAGLADLADQVARSLSARGTTRVSLRLDLSYAPGPRIPGTWNPHDVRDGFAGPVMMTGLSTQRPTAGRTPVARPDREVASAFAARLRERGLTVALRDEKTWAAAVPASADSLGEVESATYGQVLSLALAQSDNSLTENLTRQAAAVAGRRTTRDGDTASFVRSRLEAHAVPTTGLVIKDACGLSPGQRATPRTLAGVLGLAVRDQVPQLREVVAGLPVSGLSGTLSHRFDSTATEDVAGVPRAKTGTLYQGSSLAGTTVDADGRPLAFVVMVDAFPPNYGGTVRAREALDRLVAALTRCGCR
jgi:D-alanyl-D-alanine carboxypeptidase/D-alanyl-D-alanine-endopeptidase (penicillin-binding protein 4)